MRLLPFFLRLHRLVHMTLPNANVCQLQDTKLDDQLTMSDGFDESTKRRSVASRMTFSGSLFVVEAWIYFSKKNQPAPSARNQ